jgi:alpha-D-ribose 1-methylphosphonate 5-triphosphate diphosphatase
VFTLVAVARISLAAAVALGTSGPADVAGLADRGRLQPGLRADLALIAARDRWPVVHSVLVSGR